MPRSAVLPPGHLVGMDERIELPLAGSVHGPPGRADRAAQRLACNLAPLDELDDALAAADIVIAALGSGRTILTPARVAAALRRRPARPIFVIDAADGAAVDAFTRSDPYHVYGVWDRVQIHRYNKKRGTPIVSTR